MILRIIIAALILSFSTIPVTAQTVVGLFQIPIADGGTRQIGSLDPTTGSVSLIGASDSIDGDQVAIGTGITAIAVTDDVYYFVGTDQGDSLSKVYTVDNDTGVALASHTLSAYSTGSTMGLWFEESTSTLWGLFSGGGGERVLAAIDPTTGTVAPPINSDISGGPLSTVGGVFTGDPVNNRVFLIGTPDGDDPMLYEVSTLDGSVMPWFFDGWDENTVVGIEWDAVSEPQTLWMLVFQGTGRQLAQYNFEEEEIQLAPEEIGFGDPVGTNQGMTAIDDDSGQFFFIGKPNGQPWAIYTLLIPDGTASYQPIGGDPIQIGAWAGIEVIPGPALGLTKDDGVAGSVIPGDTITYTLNASNAADAGPAEGVELSETVPAETTFFAAGSTGGWVCVPNASAGSTCTLPMADIAPGGSTLVDFAVVVDASVSPTLTQIDNTAVLSATNTTTDAQATESTPVTATAVLGLGKTDGDTTTTPGSTVVYTLSASNSGDADALGTVLTDEVPADTTFNAAASSPGWSCSGGEPAGTLCTYGLGTFEGGSSADVLFAVTVVASVPAGTTQIANSASVTATNPASAMASDVTPVTSDPALDLSKTDNGANAIPGQTLSYQLDYANTGDEDAAGTTLAETVPAQTSFDAGSSTAGWVCVPGGSAGSSCSLDLGTLGGGSSGTAIFALVVDDPVLADTSEIANSATIDASNAPAPATASDTSVVVADPQLALSKHDGDIQTQPGLSLSYFLSYENEGNENAAGTVLTETVPDHTTFLAGSSTPGWTCAPDGSAGSTCSFDIGDLFGGDSDLAVFAVTVDDPIAAGVTVIANTASLDAANAPAPAAAYDDTPVNAAPDLTLTKDDGGITAAPNGVVVYTLSYANEGDQNAAGGELEEIVPALSIFEPASSSTGWVCVPDGSAGSTCELDVGDVDGGGGGGNADFAVRVNDPFPTGVSEISNTATFSASNGVNSPTAMDTTPVEVLFDLAVTKNDGDIFTRSGGTIPYTIEWSNPGNQSATGVELTEIVPVATTFDPGSSSASWTCVPDNTAGSTCSYSVGDAAAGATDQVVFAVVVDNPVSGGITTIENTVSIDDDGSSGADVDPSNNSDATSTPIDDSPPVVASIDTIPSVGGISPCTQVGISAGQLAVELNDIGSGVADAADLGDYMVVAAGPDQTVDTTQCGPIFGDDVEILISGITVSGTAHNPVATLELSARLPNGIVNVLVCDTIGDVAGNWLDGDGDGAAGGDFAVRFRVDVGNEFSNAHLDDCDQTPISLAPWMDDAAPPSSVAATMDYDVDGSQHSGAIVVSSVKSQTITVGQCLPVDQGSARWLEAWAMISDTTIPDVIVELICAYSEMADCVDLGPADIHDRITLASTPSPEFIYRGGGGEAPPMAISAFCGVRASTVTEEPFELVVDAFFLNNAIFVDGFESGDVSAWDGVTP